MKKSTFAETGKMGLPLGITSSCLLSCRRKEDKDCVAASMVSSLFPDDMPEIVIVSHNLVLQLHWRDKPGLSPLS